MVRVTLRLLGGFEARIESGPALVLPTRKTQALLAYLALSAGTAHPRDKLTALLWGATGDRQARHSLRQALFALRKALVSAITKPEGLVEGELVALDPAAVSVDAVLFERGVREGTPEALEGAMDLYRGDLLEGLAVKEPGFEEWLAAERERLRELAVEALARLVTVHDKRGALEPAIRAAQRLLALDPLQEAAHRAVMRLYARDGRRGTALRQYQLCLDVLQRELGAEPESETRAIYHDLLRGRGPGPAGVPQPEMPAASPSAPTNGVALIGRDAELARLRRVLNQARQGRGGVAAVIGEAGVGKSRLVAELAATAHADGTRVVVGRAYEMEGALPLGPWIDAMQLGQGGPDLTAPGLADDPLRLFETVAQFVARLASASPLLVVLEDLHWADETSLNLLAFISRQIAGWAVVVVATAREEELTPRLGRLLGVIDEQGGTTVRLGRLSRPATVSLVHALAQPGQTPSAQRRLAVQMWKLSEGNPFMVVEAVRAALDRGRARPRGRLPLPDRIRTLVLGRIERLTEPAQRVVGAAAVIGREFEFALLRRVVGLGERPVAQGVEELVRRRLLRATGELLEFTHDSIRQVAGEQLLEPTRRALHHAAAEALETAHTDRPDAVVDRLAHHYAQSGDAAKAVHYLTLSAEAAYGRSAILSAIRSLEQALAHARRQAPDARDRSRLDVSLRLATALSNLGRFGEILALLQPLRDLAKRVDDPVLSGIYHFRLALTQSLIGHHAEADRAARLALDEAARSGDAATSAKAHYVLAVEGFSTGRALYGVEHGRRAVALLEPLDDRRWVSLACWILGLNHLFLGELDTALELERRAAALGAAVADRSLESFSAGAAAWIELTRGAWERAREAAEQAAERAPDAATRASAQGALAYARFAGGGAGPAKTVRALEAAIEQLGQFGIRQSLALTHLAETHRQSGNLDKAESAATRCLALGRQIGFAWAVASAERLLGRIALGRGAHAAARAHLQEALQTFELIPARFEVARTREDLAVLERPVTMRSGRKGAGF